MVVRFNSALIPKIVNSAKQSIEDSNEVVLNEVRRLVLNTPKTGRIYRHPITGLPHQASAPGEAFANMTGNALANTKTYKENGGLKGRITGEAEYAAYLELGTSRMAARPVFRPALANKTPEIIETFKKNVRKALK